MSKHVSKYVCHECGKDAGHSIGYGSDGNRVWCHGCGQDIANDAIVEEETKEEGLELEFPDDQLLMLCLMAHKKDMTLNDYLNEVLDRVIRDIKESEPLS